MNTKAHDPAWAEFEQRVRARMPSMTLKRRRIAQLMLERPYAVLIDSIDTIARESEADAATVVRVCQDLGYDGFSGLKRALHDDLLPSTTAAEKIRQIRESFPTDLNPLTQVLLDDIRNLERAASLNMPEVITNVARLIRNDARVVVIACGLSFHVGAMLAHLLRLAGVDAHASESEVETAVQIARVTPSDVVICITVWRYVDTSMRLFKEAGRHGATRVAITDNEQSPATSLADFVLLAPTRAAELPNSMVSPMSMVNALVTAVIHEDPDISIKALTAVDDVYESADVV